MLVVQIDDGDRRGDTSCGCDSQLQYFINGVLTAAIASAGGLVPTVAAFTVEIVGRAGRKQNSHAICQPCFGFLLLLSRLATCSVHPEK